MSATDITVVPADRRPAVSPTGVAAAADIGVIRALLKAKSGTVVSVCIPARDEAATITAVVETALMVKEIGLVDEVVVVDDCSTDATATRARSAGADVVASSGRPGKGQAMRLAALRARGDILVFLDADVTNYTVPGLVDLVAPLLLDEGLQLVKGAYRRPLAGRDGEGGRVTELLARPLLERFHPALAAVAQPLAGESAIRRSALQRLRLDDGYGIEIGLLIDVRREFGLAAIAEVDLGVRIHRNRPLDQLRPQARDVLGAVLERSPFTSLQEARHDH